MRKFSYVLAFTLFILFVGCVGGGGSSDDNNPPVALPLLDILEASFPNFNQFPDENSKVIAYDHISKANLDKGIAYLKNDSFSCINNYECTKHDPIATIDDAKTDGGLTSDMGINDKGYMIALGLVNYGASEVNSNLFKQVYPTIDGEEAIALAAEYFSSGISSSILSNYETKLKNYRFEYDSANDIYYKTENGILYMSLYRLNKNIAYWIVARDDYTIGDVIKVFNL
jgi:hypothetical protein